MKLNPSSHELRESALAAIADSLVSDQSQQVEELETQGWFTAVAIARKKGETRNAVDKKLRRKVEAGEMEMQKILINGRYTVFFRLL